MRDYLDLNNLWRAMALAAAVTLMAVPRILQAGQPLAFYLPTTFLAMTLVAGAVMAWGRCGRMVGPFPEPRRLLAGLGAAALLAAALIPLALPLDAALKKTLADAERAYLIPLEYPDDPGGGWVLLLWSAGFETLFFQGAAMAFFARITGRQDVAVLGAVVLRLYVTYRKLAVEGVAPMPAALALNGAACLVGCVLFARAGLPAAMLFAAGLSARLWLLAR